MAVLCWMAVTLAMLLSAGNSLADVNQNDLAEILPQILQKFTPRTSLPMFSLAVSVPFDSKTKKYDVNKVTDPANDVINALTNCELYTGQMVVAATVLKWAEIFTRCPNGRVQSPDILKKCPPGVVTWANVKDKCPQAIEGLKNEHAEYRSAEKLSTLVNKKNKKGLLVFYVFASPCVDKCTDMSNRNNILTFINTMTGWSNYAFVFTEAYDTPESTKKSLSTLGNFSPLGKTPVTRIGLQNIFRCTRQSNEMLCTSCSTGGNVTPACVTTTEKPGASNTNLPSPSGSRAGGGGSR